MRAQWSKVVCLLSCLVAACGGDGRGEDHDRLDAALDASPLKAQPDQPTYASSVRLLDGYTPMFEQGTEPCVAPIDDPNGGPAVDVGSVSSRFDLVLVSSRHELATALGIDLDLKIKYGAGSVDPSFHLLDTFTGNDRSVFVLVRVAHSYKVQDARKLALTPEAAELVGDPSSFLPTCGSHFVGAATYEARLVIGLRFDTADADSARDLAAGLGLEVGMGPVGIDTDFGAKAKNQAKSHSALVTMAVASDGYTLGGDDDAIDATTKAVQALLGSTLESDMVTKLQSLSANMAASIHQDRCRDDPAAEGCNGSGPGYLQNGSRNARLTRLDLRPYQGVKGAPKGKPWLELHGAIKRVDDYLRAVGPLVEDLEAIHRVDISPFLAASSAGRAKFGLTSPAAPAYDRPELEKVVSAWDAALRPHVGKTVKPIEDALEACFVGAMGGDFGACDGDPAGTEAYGAAADALASYQAGPRVLPLAYQPTAGATSRDQASAACVKMGLRLPTRSEVERMAVAVRRANDLPPGGTLPHTVWHSGPSKWCTAFYNPPEAGTTSASLDKCGPNGDVGLVLPALCIPSSGPFIGE